MAKRGPNTQQMLLKLITLGEAIVERSKGRSVLFRISITRFRVCVENLKKYCNATWYNSVQEIVEKLNEFSNLLEGILWNLEDTGGLYFSWVSDYSVINKVLSRGGFACIACAIRAHMSSSSHLLFVNQSTDLLQVDGH